ncbi:hypothetical protein WJX72_004939 [[Myrmecia] bisecta]|uniref:Uncharacterized protein n=1 Tax=[Myrmecia] bisecta TaxID=41462 RepID=A0AAW1Q0S6_9CHLO
MALAPGDIADAAVPTDAEEPAEGSHLLDSLGVTAVSTVQVEKNLLAKAEKAAAGKRGAKAKQSADTRQERLQQQLAAVGKELRAVYASLDDLQEPEPDQDQAEHAEADSEGLRLTSASLAAADTSRQLQRATVAQRLEDLEAQQERLQVALDAELRAAAAEAGGEAPQEPAAPSDNSAEASQDQPAAASKAKRNAKKAQQGSVLLEEDDTLDAELKAAANTGGLVETERDRLIRLGVLTPFDQLDGFEKKIKSGSAQRPTAATVPMNPAQERQANKASTSGRGQREPVNQHPSFARLQGRYRALHETAHKSKLVDPSELPKRQSAVRRVDEMFWRQGASNALPPPPKRKRRRTLATAAKKTKIVKPVHRKKRRTAAGHSDSAEDHSGSEYGPSDEEAALDDDAASETDSDMSDDLSGEFDDADQDLYDQRRRRYEQQQAELLEEAGEVDPEDEDVVFDGGFQIPGNIYKRLFDYQRTGVKWLWELHTQRAGGIIGDEMGLGKTVQLAAFLGGLHHSGLFRPSLIVCPATVLRQWLRELRSWYPKFRVVIMHDSARSAGLRPSKRDLIDSIYHSEAGVLITSYDQMRLQRDELLNINWGYVILDEGHKIRNPDAEVTLVAKQLQTVHRIIMSGSPIQNRLTELWSLFDFVFPGKLGTLPVFQTQFALPIQIGGYANASSMQVSTAYKCAVVLRDLIAPYLLRRRKADVAMQLPKKTEQVLFCTLSKEQRDMYRAYLNSKEVEDILEGHRNALAGIDILRKICNHPDLLERTKYEGTEDYGNPERSAKLTVALKVLAHWHAQGHKALVFTQTQQMLDIMERAVQSAGYAYHRMDGSTAIQMRARLVDDFNNNEDVFVFLLTTKVGGLGVNLTGADRVMVFDPDWNPSTDMQARERAWRIGQQREVTVYRLITSGTIEEKVYHRQVYKQFLTNKVLQDPRQKRFFKSKDIHDLFQLGDEYAQATETASIFASLNGEVYADGASAAATDAQIAAWAPSGAASQSAVATSAPGSADGASEHSDGSHKSDSTAARTPGSAPSAGGVSSRRQERGSGSASRRRKGTAVAGETGSDGVAAVEGVVRSEVLLLGPEAEEQSPPAGPSGRSGDDPGDDAKILRDLFEGTGIMSAMDHSKIESANDPEARSIDHEASRIARRAAEALRQSRAACQNAAVNVPTWTGRSGAAGAGPVPARRFGTAANPRLQRSGADAVSTSETGSGPSSSTAGPAAGPGQRRFGSGSLAGTTGGSAPRSSELLARMRARQQDEAAGPGPSASSAPGDAEVAQAQVLTAQIVSFLESHDGRAPTADVIAHFQSEVGAAQAAIFRQVLQQVAKLQRDGDGKVWVLKPEFVS